MIAANISVTGDAGARSPQAGTAQAPPASGFADAVAQAATQAPPQAARPASVAAAPASAKPVAQKPPAPSRHEPANDAADVAQKAAVAAHKHKTLGDKAAATPSTMSALPSPAAAMAAPIATAAAPPLTADAAKAEADLPAVSGAVASSLFKPAVTAPAFQVPAGSAGPDAAAPPAAKAATMSNPPAPTPAASQTAAPAPANAEPIPQSPLLPTAFALPSGLIAASPAAAAAVGPEGDAAAIAVQRRETVPPIAMLGHPQQNPLPLHQPAQAEAPIITAPPAAAAALAGIAPAGPTPAGLGLAGAAPTGTVQPGAMPSVAASSGPLAASALASPLPMSNFGHAAAALAASVSAMVKDGKSSVLLRLSPPDLGSLSIHLAVGQDAQVNVLLVAALPQTAQVFAAGADDLRQAFAASGLALGQLNIGGGTAGQTGQQSGGQTGQPQRPPPTASAAQPGDPNATITAAGVRAIA